MTLFKRTGVLLLLVASLSVSAQQTVFTPKNPEAGKRLSFTYNPSGTVLSGKKEVTCKAKVFVNLKQTMVKIPLVKEGDVFKGSFVPADHADLVCLMFSDGELVDENAKGYYTLFYDKGIATANAYLVEVQLLTGMGRVFKIKPDFVKGVKLYEIAFAAKPALKEEYISAYFEVIYAADKVKGAQVIKREIQALKKENNVSENALVTLLTLNNILKNQVAVDSIKAVIIARYPRGNTAYKAESSVYKEKDPDVIALKIDERVKKYGLDVNNKADAEKISSLYYPLVHMYAMVSLLLFYQKRHWNGLMQQKVQRFLIIMHLQKLRRII